jgi:hypothetical protein
MYPSRLSSCIDRGREQIDTPTEPYKSTKVVTDLAQLMPVVQAMSTVFDPSS